MNDAEEPGGEDTWAEVIIEQCRARGDQASQLTPLALSHKSEQSMEGN